MNERISQSVKESNEKKKEMRRQSKEIIKEQISPRKNNKHELFLYTDLISKNAALVDAHRTQYVNLLPVFKPPSARGIFTSKGNSPPIVAH